MKIEAKKRKTVIHVILLYKTLTIKRQESDNQQ